MSRKFIIALAQMSAEENKIASLQKAVKMMKDAHAEDADLIVFPEVCMTKFFPQYRADSSWFEQAELIPGGVTCETLQKAAADNGLGVVVSLLERTISSKCYDTAAVIDKDGKLLGVQRMMHVAEEENYNEKFYYAPGDSNYPVFQIGSARVGVAVCQDQFYPEHIRLLNLHGAELIVVPTTIAAETDPMLLASRSGAVLNHVFFAGANRVGTEGAMTFIGQSHVVDPQGNVMKMAKTKGDELVVQEIDLDRVQYVRTHQNFWLRDRRPETYGDLAK